jgi:hypothetical protein
VSHGCESSPNGPGVGSLRTGLFLSCSGDEILLFPSLDRRQPILVGSARTLSYDPTRDPDETIAPLTSRGEKGGRWEEIEIAVHLPREDIVYTTEKVHG